MRLVANSGNDRVLDVLRKTLTSGGALDLASPEFSLFAFAELREALAELAACRIILPQGQDADLRLLGGDADRPLRNRLHSRAVARECARWIREKAEVRRVPGSLPQAAMVAADGHAGPRGAITGDCVFSTGGLGVTPGNPYGLTQCSETGDEARSVAGWFDALWRGLPQSEQAKAELLDRLDERVAHQPPSLVYYLILYHLFKDLGEALDEDRIVKSATGIRNTVVWRKLFKFQRDGVIGALDKLERLGGCIIADSVGLGKTFEALAIIKYYELRNDRVLVLVPKRLRDNWTLFKEVVEAVHCTEPVQADAPTAAEALFLQSLAVAGLPRGDLYALYQGWVDRVAALEAARITGVYTAPVAAGEGDTVREGVEAYQTLTRELATLRARAKREKQVARLAELNMEIKRREAETGCVTTRLCAAHGVATGFASS